MTLDLQLDGECRRKFSKSVSLNEYFTSLLFLVNILSLMCSPLPNLLSECILFLLVRDLFSSKEVCLYAGDVFKRRMQDLGTCILPLYFVSYFILVYICFYCTYT